MFFFNLLKETLESFLTPITMWGHKKRTAIYAPESSSHRTLDLPTPLFRTSYSPGLRKINFCRWWHHSIVTFCCIFFIYLYSVTFRYSSRTNEDITPNSISLVLFLWFVGMHIKENYVSLWCTCSQLVQTRWRSAFFF